MLPTELSLEDKPLQMLDQQQRNVKLHQIKYKDSSGHNSCASTEERIGVWDDKNHSDGTGRMSWTLQHVL